MPSSRTRAAVVIPDYPPISTDRGLGFWGRPRNLWAARKHLLRADHSNQWRTNFHTENQVPPDHSKSVSELIDEPKDAKRSDYKFIVLADTGEGDKSQYGLLPLIRALKPDFVIINGDVAYPSGDIDDFTAGFFEPYANLDVPVWATPGNHEYYSRQSGREFYQVFCTYTYRRRWTEYGLRLVPQPGMYWEINDPDANLVILGLDSGMMGNLDGVGGPDDKDQHSWLRSRLDLAQSRGQNAIVLFHIPGLVNGNHAKGTHLERLHNTLASYTCVRLVLTGHEHSFQKYAASDFEKYVNRGLGPAMPKAREDFPDYMVIGGGGAFLASTEWFGSRLPFACKEAFPLRKAFLDRLSMERLNREKDEQSHPPASRWESLKRWGGRAKDRVGEAAYKVVQSKWGTRTIRWIGGDSVRKAIVSSADTWVNDADLPDFLSFLLVEVTGRGTADPVVTATPIFQNKLSDLYQPEEPEKAETAGTRIDVQAGRPEPYKKRVDDCRQSKLAVSWHRPKPSEVVELQTLRAALNAAVTRGQAEGPS